MSPLIENLMYGASSIQFGTVGTYDPVRLRQDWEAVAARHQHELTTSFITSTSHQRAVGMLGMFVAYLAAIGATVVVAPINEALACGIALLPALAMVGLSYWK